MEYVRFGSTGLKVSPLAFGMVFREQTDDQKAQRVVEEAIDRGINFIDCANTYGPTDDRSFGPGRSEKILAKAIKGKRDDVIITSKVDESVGLGPNDSGLSRYHIMREVENSLTRLGTDRIDIYLAHHPDPTTSIYETVSAFDQLITDGKIRYYGLCNFKAWQTSKALWTADKHGLDPAACVQASYNLIDRSLEHEVLELVRDQNLGVMAYGTLAVGLLSGVYSADAPPPKDRLWGSKWRDRFEGRLQGKAGLVLQVIQEVGEELGKTRAQVATGWVLANPAVSVAIMGCDDVTQLDENLGSIGWEFSDEQLERLNIAGT